MMLKVSTLQYSNDRESPILLLNKMGKRYFARRNNTYGIDSGNSNLSSLCLFLAKTTKNYQYALMARITSSSSIRKPR